MWAVFHSMCTRNTKTGHIFCCSNDLVCCDQVRKPMNNNKNLKMGCEKRSGSKFLSCFCWNLKKHPRNLTYIHYFRNGHIWSRRYMNSIRPIILGPKIPLVFRGAFLSIMQQRLLHQHRGRPRSSKSQGNGGTKSWQTNRRGTAKVAKINKRFFK